ncbi:MAG: FtsX-like permease family protein [Lachnospiraceae bacterium]|nr:FtsX-like permease family protein [Lachnospiraceae bacterium]
MRIIDLIRMGLKNLFRRKARTILTIVGVVIGTVSIVVMVSVGMGMNRSFEASVMENGSMTIINVSSNSWSESENGEWTSTKQKLDETVAEQLRGIEHVKGVSPVINNWSAQLYCGKYQSWANLMVMDMAYYEEFGYPTLEDGTYPTKEEARTTIYYGNNAISEFQYWSGTKAQTKTVDLEHDKVVLKFNEYQLNPRKKEYEYLFDTYKKIAPKESGYSEADYSIFMDIDLYKDIYKKYANTLTITDRKKAMASLDSYEQIRINVDNMNYVTEVQDKIEALGYKSESNMQYIEPMKNTANMLEIVLGAIGAIAMLVSAINIANTMIMSIYERTKEIGIMKVLGCKVSDIRKLFLFEAGMIGLIGGLIGIGLSYLASVFINKYGSALIGGLFDSGSGETMALSYIPLWLPFAGAAFAMMIGILSGFFPAVRATKISAIEAMKSAE